MKVVSNIPKRFKDAACISMLYICLLATPKYLSVAFVLACRFHCFKSVIYIARPVLISCFGNGFLSGVKNVVLDSQAYFLHLLLDHTTKLVKMRLSCNSESSNVVGTLPVESSVQ